MTTSASLGRRGVRAAVAAGVLAILGTIASPPPMAVADVPSHRIVDLTVDSPLIDTGSPGGHLVNERRQLHVRVVLPSGYASDPTKRYPVLYLLHGATKDDTFYTDELGLDSIDAITAKQPAIVVTPDASTDGMYMNWHDGTDAWTDFHLQHVVPLIEQRFRVLAGRQWHAVAGISMGGQGTLRYASLLPGYFGTAIALSPGFPDTQAPLYASEFAPAVSNDVGAPVTYDDVYSPVTGAYATGSNPTTLVGNLRYTRLYISAGDGVHCPGDPVNDLTPLATVIEPQVRVQVPPYVQKARDAGVQVTEHLTCGGHENAIWRREFSRIPSAFGLFAPVAADPTTWTYTTALDHGDAWQLAYRTSTAPTSVLRFTRTGRTLSGTGSGTGAITFTAPGCRFAATPPFSMTLPAGCR